jgi:hypothetical protein
VSLTMMPPSDLSSLSPSEKDALIAALLARVQALLVEVEGLRTENAALRDKLRVLPQFPCRGVVVLGRDEHIGGTLGGTLPLAESRTCPSTSYL